MVTTTSNVSVFDQSYYQAIADKVKKYVLEDQQINWVPTAPPIGLHMPLYKKPIFGASVGTQGGHSLTLPEQTMETPKSHKVYNLEYVQGNIKYDAQDMMLEGNTLAQRKAQELSTWVNHTKQAIFKGVFTKGFTAAGAGVGNRLNDGIIEQATLVENLNGTDSLLDAAGDVYLALSKIVSSIPFRFRDGKQVLIGCDDLFARMARKALFRGATNQDSEFDLFLKEQSTAPYVQNGQEVKAKLIISDQLFLNKVAGTTKTEVDTLGTHSRLFAAVIDPEVIEQAYSFRGRTGDEVHPSIGAVTSTYAARCSGCVHEPEAVVYSERLTWA